MKSKRAKIIGFAPTTVASMLGFRTGKDPVTHRTVKRHLKAMPHRERGRALAKISTLGLEIIGLNNNPRHAYR